MKPSRYLLAAVLATLLSAAHADPVTISGVKFDDPVDVRGG